MSSISLSGVRMAATSPSSFSVGSTVSYMSRARSHPVSRVQSLRFSPRPLTLSSRSLFRRPGSICLSKALCTKPQAVDKFELQHNGSFKIAIIGSPLGIGHALSTSLKKSPLVSAVHFYSIGGLEHLNVCLDPPLSQEDIIGLKKTLKDADVVVIAPRLPKPEMWTLEDVFFSRARIVRSCVEAISDQCKDAFILIDNEDLNSVVPMAAEVLKQKGRYDPNRLFGLMTPEVELAKAFVAQRFFLDVNDVQVPVIGGHSMLTTLPLFSKTEPPVILYSEDINLWTSMIHYYGTGGSEDLDFFAGKQDLEFFEARGAERFILSLLNALDGAEDIVQCCFVESTATDIPFFGSRVKLGKTGVEAFIKTDLEGLTEYEAKSLKYLKEDLIEDIEKGVEFANKSSTAS